MGADDANEGHAAGECIEHVWGLVEVVAGPSGSHVEKACTRCGAVTLVGPHELGGWA